jgi:hypothetical protein
MNYKIKPFRGHFEVYINGIFYCSADTLREAVSELDQYFARESGRNEIESA